MTIITERPKSTYEQLEKQVELFEMSQRSLFHEIERLKKLSKSRLKRLRRAETKFAAQVIVSAQLIREAHGG